MRADRLVAALLLLQSHGRLTAGDLARELEVSTATARRDMEALSAAGIPVYPRPGRGGGWELVGGARTNLTGLSAAEAEAVFLLVGPATSLSPEARTAVRKLVRALPSTFRTGAEAAAQATSVDPSRWGRVGPERPPTVDLLNRAVIRRRKVALTYRSRTGLSGPRLVDPLGTVDKDGVWYLLAGTPDGQRTFRVDRMEHADVTDQPALRPNGFDLETAWQDVVDRMEDRRSRTWATVDVAERYLPIVRDHFGRHLRDEGVDAKGTARIQVAAPTPLDLARNLAGWGALVDVVAPESVRLLLGRIGAELAARYGGTAERQG